MTQRRAALVFMALCAACESALGLERAHLADAGATLADAHSAVSGACEPGPACGWVGECEQDVATCLRDETCRLGLDALSSCLKDPEQGCDGATCLESFPDPNISNAAIGALNRCLLENDYLAPGCAGEVATPCELLCACLGSPAHCEAKAERVWDGDLDLCLDACATLYETDLVHKKRVVGCRLSHCRVASPATERVMHCDHAWPESGQHLLCRENDTRPEAPVAPRCFALGHVGDGCEDSSECCSGNCPSDTLICE